MDQEWIRSGSSLPKENPNFQKWIQFSRNGSTMDQKWVKILRNESEMNQKQIQINRNGSRKSVIIVDMCIQGVTMSGLHLGQLGEWRAMGNLRIVQDIFFRP